jgi:hypothetical protein
MKQPISTLTKKLKQLEESGAVNRHPPFPMLFHDQDKVIKHFIHGVGLFQEELADLPCKV